MTSRIINTKKWKDLINLKEIEVIISIIVSLIIIILMYKLNFHKNFIYIKESIKTILSVFLGGLFAMLGFILTGIAVVISIFDIKLINAIKRKNNKDIILIILTSFEFSAFSVAITLILISITYTLISFDIVIISPHFFYSFSFIIIYLILFNIFYIISLIGNCISLYQIKSDLDEMPLINKSLIEECNEIRIDFILNSLGESLNLSRDDIRNKLIDFNIKSNSKNKHSINDYLEDYYK